MRSGVCAVLCTHMQRTSVQDFLFWILDLINTGIIPFLFAIAFFFFIWNAARFFVFKGTTEEGQDSAKRLMIYGIAAMVLMLSLWGLVRLMTGALGVNRHSAPCPDFNPDGFELDGGRGGGSAFPGF